MTEISELLNLSPSNLARRQAKAYAAHLERVLDAARETVRCVRFAPEDGKIHTRNVDGIVFNSPAGDGMGSDDTCLDFSVRGLPDSPRGFGDAINYLNQLIETSNVGQA